MRGPTTAMKNSVAGFLWFLLDVGDTTEDEEDYLANAVAEAASHKRMA